MHFWRKNGNRDVFIQTARLLANNLGDRCEVMVCEVFERAFFRIVHIENPAPGHAIGEICQHLTPNEVDGEFKCEVRASPDGRTRRISASAIYGPRRILEGAVITSLDISEIVFTQNWLHSLTGHVPHSAPMQCDDVGQMMDLLIDQASSAIGKPVAYMNRADKKDFIKHLDERGVFQIKKSSERVAKFLDISKFTLYACLEEIRAER